MKQDIAGVRTAQDLERKYNFSSIKKAVELQEKLLNKTNDELDKFVNATVSTIDNLQEQIDGNITTYYYSGVPNLNNLPVSEWELIDYNKHLGDLYYDKETGYAYRFYLDSNTGMYGWIKLTDSDVTEALALANAAKDTADSKRRVFTTQPIPPYENGDMWINNQEIYICQISKIKGQSFSTNDFIIATKYTDDTKANEVDGKLTVLGGTVLEIQEGVNNLTSTMTETQTILNEHDQELGVMQSKQTVFEQTITGFSTTVLEQTNAINNLENTVDGFDEQLTDAQEEILNEAVATVQSTMLTQTSEVFEMLFSSTGIQDAVGNVQEALASNNAKLIRLDEYVRFEGAKITLGKSSSQTKLVIENDRISFMNGTTESAYISENTLYITDSTILKKLNIGHWEEKEDEYGNLNTKWVGGVS